MIELACIAAVVILAGVQAWQNHQAQGRWANERDSLHNDYQLALDKAAAERQTLLQRIQAPEVAVTQHQVDMAGPDLPAVNLEDDADYWKAQQDALERMEQLERQFEARIA